MNIKIGSFLNLSANITPHKNIWNRRLRFKITPFIIRALKIGDLFNLTSGITYVKILTEPISEITPKIKVDIRKISLSELLNSDLRHLSGFLPYVEGQKTALHKDSMKCFIATRGNELVYFTAVGYARGRRLMISGTQTLKPFRGNHINPAALVI